MAHLRSAVSYAGAVSAVAVATLTTAVLWRWLAPSVSILFFPAVMVAATYGGLWPGLVATILSATTIAYFFSPPYWSFKLTAADLIRLIAFVGATTLITSIANAKRRAEVALHASLRRDAEMEAARQNERLKAALLDALTHNLRTPLTAMKAAITALRDQRVDTPETRQELVQVIDEEVDRLDRFVGGLGGPMRPARAQSIDVQDVLRAVQGKAATVARQHHLALTVSPDLSALMVDRAAVIEALYIVVENAAKYSAAGTVITLDAQQHDAHAVRVTVTDQGPGIPADLQERVFERFFRIPQAGPAVSGSGLGLAIARQLLQTQGGRIWLDRAPGGSGTRVTLVLPCAIVLDAT